MCTPDVDAHGVPYTRDPLNDMAEVYGAELTREFEGRQPLAVARLPVLPWTRGPDVVHGAFRKAQQCRWHMLSLLAMIAHSHAGLHTG